MVFILVKGVPATPSVKSLIEPGVSTERLLSLTHCLGDASGAFLFAVEITAAPRLVVRD